MSKTNTQPKTREYKVLPVYMTDVDEAEGIIEAVVNVFGIIDLGDDIIHNGAYTKTLNERGNQVRVKVLDNHNTGSILNVIGKPLEIREIGRDELARIAPQVVAQHPEATGGLFTRTQFQLSTPEGVGAFKRLAEGYVSEWSIALDALVVDYAVVTTPEGKKKSVRNIRQIRLWEYSPVVFGMNQATVTTDVKTADEAPETERLLSPETIAKIRALKLFDDEDETVQADEQKRGSLAAKLEANMRMGYAYCVNDWLSYGIIDADTIMLLDVALMEGMSAFRASMPPEVALMDIEYYSADGTAERKAGRVISARNRSTIEQAITALQALLDAADADTSEGSASADDADETEDDKKALTGPDAQEVNPVVEPSITMSLEDVDPADIEREFAELSVMMEMEHELQGNH